MECLSNFSKRERSFLFISTFYIAFVTFPLIEDLTHIPIQIPSILTVFGITYLYPKSYLNRTMAWVFVYGCILFSYIAFNKPFYILTGENLSMLTQFLMEFATILPTLLITNTLLSQNNKELYKVIFLISSVLFLISFLFILPTLLTNGAILRYRIELSYATGGTEKLNILGMPKYSLMHAYVMIVPSLIYGLQITRGKSKLLTFVLLMLFSYIVLKTYVFASMVLLFVMFIWGLISNSDNLRRTIIISIFIVFMSYILVKSGILLSILYSFNDVVENTSIEGKVKDIQTLLEEGYVNSSTIEGREAYHDISINNFINTPFCGNEQMGGHSVLLDHLSGLGLIGFIPFIMIMLSLVNRLNKSFDYAKTKRFFFIGFVSCLVFLYNKGVFGWDGWTCTFVILPSWLMYFEQFHYNKKINK